MVNEDGYELSLTINFALRGSDDSYINKSSLGGGGGGGTKEFLSSYTRGGQNSAINGYGSMESLGTNLFYIQCCIFTQITF